MNESLRKEIGEKSKFDNEPLQYQSFDGSKGNRDMLHRYGVMGLNDFNFKNKSVLDIGCNLGVIGLECMKRGASKYVGLEYHPPTVEVSAKLFKEEGVLHKGKVLEYDVNSGLAACRKLIGDHKYDYVFALAIIKHTNDEDLFNLINFYSDKYIFFEGHNRHRKRDPKEFEETWRTYLNDELPNKKIMWLGNSTDHGKRLVFLIEK